MFVVVNLTVGNIGGGLTLSDLMVFPFAILLLALQERVSRNLVIFVFVMIALELLGALGIVFRNESSAISYFFLLVVKLALVLTMTYFGRAVATRPNLRIIDRGFFVGLVSAAGMTAFHLATGTRAFYGPAQILATNFPAQSGFALMSISVYFLWRLSNGGKLIHHLAFAAATASLFFVLSAASIVTSGVLLLIYLIRTVGFIGIASSITVGAGAIFLKLGSSIGWDSLLRRLIRLPEKILYRSEKIIENISDCADLSCMLIGKGLGYHSYLSREFNGTSSFLNFDNLPLRLYYELGVPGIFILFIIPLVFAFRRLRWFTPAHWAFLVSILVYAFTVEFAFVSHMAGQFAVMAGLLFPRRKRGARGGVARRHRDAKVGRVFDARKADEPLSHLRTKQEVQ